MKVNTMNKIVINSESSFIDERLDKVLASIEKNFSRTYIEKMCENGKVFVNGKLAKSSHYRLRSNDIIEYDIPLEEKIELKPIAGDLDIAYEDDDVLVVNKPQGLVVHPAPGHKDDTLVNMLVGKISSLSTNGGDFRPGIVHRIDKDTSGLLLIAKNNRSHAFLSSLLKDHNISREYYALVEGIIYEDDGKVIAPIGRDQKFRQKMAVDTLHGKDAITHFHVIKRYKNATLIACKLETGRTHQIRVHMAYIGHPVVGDQLYNKKKYPGLTGQMLHAYRLTFPQPTTKKEIVVETKLPQYFEDELKKFE